MAINVGRRLQQGWQFSFEVDEEAKMLTINMEKGEEKFPVAILEAHTKIDFKDLSIAMLGVFATIQNPPPEKKEPEYNQQMLIDTIMSEDVAAISMTVVKANEAESKIWPESYKVVHDQLFLPLLACAARRHADNLTLTAAENPIYVGEDECLN